MLDELKFKETVSKNLIKYRKAHGLTQAGLAEKLNYSDKAISKWERGESIPDAYTLNVIADFYGITINDLYLEEKKEIIPVKHNYKINTLITLLSFFLAWFVVLVVYFIIDNIDSITWDAKWIIILWAIPISFIPVTVFSALWFNNLVKSISVSCLVWGLALSLQLLIKHTTPNKASFIYIIAASLQVLIILFFVFMHTIKAERNKK